MWQPVIQQSKVAAFLAKRGWQVNIEIFDMFQILADILKETARDFFLPAGLWSSISAF